MIIIFTVKTLAKNFLHLYTDTWAEIGSFTLLWMGNVACTLADATWNVLCYTGHRPHLIYSNSVEC